MKIISNPPPPPPSFLHTHYLYCGNPFISPAVGLIKWADINKFTSLVLSSALRLSQHTKTLRRTWPNGQIRADTGTHCFSASFWLCTLHIHVVSADWETRWSVVSFGRAVLCRSRKKHFEVLFSSSNRWDEVSRCDISQYWSLVTGDAALLLLCECLGACSIQMQISLWTNPRSCTVTSFDCMLSVFTRIHHRRCYWSILQ